MASAEMMCHQWSKEMDQNGFHSEYKFLALDDDDMTPFRFVMMGRNAVIDSYVRVLGRVFILNK